MTVVEAAELQKKLIRFSTRHEATGAFARVIDACDSALRCGVDPAKAVKAQVRLGMSYIRDQLEAMTATKDEKRRVEILGAIAHLEDACLSHSCPLGTW